MAAPSSLEPQAHRLAAIFALVIVFWISEAIPLAATALLGPALAVPLGVAGAREAFGSFGHPIIFLFMGSFLIARAMRIHGLDRRIALFVLSRAWVGEHPGRILLAFGAIAWFLSMWMSNTATTAMMLPIGLGVLGTLTERDEAEHPGRRAYATGLMLMIAFSCNVGGIATPVGTPPNPGAADGNDPGRDPARPGLRLAGLGRAAAALALSRGSQLRAGRMSRRTRK